MPSSVNQFLNSIADAGLDFLLATTRARKPSPRTPVRSCRELLSTLGEASGTAIARDIVIAYGRMDETERLQFFEDLRTQFDVDPDKVIAAAEAYRSQPDLRSLLALGSAVEAPRQELFRRINTAPDASATLVAMRRDLLRVLPERPELQGVEADLRHLLSSWFNRGFLTLQRIDWNSPAAVLERLIRYESVHAIEGWDDLHRRLAADRRCFAFFHPALADDPVIFVEVALVRGMADAIRPLLDREAPVLRPEAADTAIFYSINNCHDGLRGISFGNFLIKQVVLEIAREIPSVRTFATLSPISDFRKWLASVASDPGSLPLSEDERLSIAALDDDDWAERPDAAERLRPVVTGLCAWYLLKAKRDGAPIDAVARFHLRNGARLERIDWLADRSPKALRDAAGLMANYVYDPKSIEKNHEEYVRHQNVVASPSIQRLVPRARRPAI